MTVFVSIAAYNEPLLRETCEGLLDTADGLVSVGVCAQGAALYSDDLPRGVRTIHSRRPLGMCRARYIAASLYDGEDLWFQIDGHMYDWQDGWDSALIEQIERIRGAAVISKFPPDDEIGPIASGTQAQLIFHPTGQLRDEAGMWRPTAVEMRLGLPYTEDIRSEVLITGCMFTRGRFLDEVGVAPWPHFTADEAVHAVRAVRAGWQLYYMAPTPCRHVNRRRRPQGVIRTEKSVPPTEREDRLAREYLAP